MNGIQAYSNCGALQTNEMLLFYTHKHTHGGCNAMCNASIWNSMFDFLKKCYSKTYFRRFILSAYFSLSLTVSRSGFWVNFSAFKPFTISMKIFSRRKKNTKRCLFRLVAIFYILLKLQSGFCSRLHCFSSIFIRL